MKSSLFVNVVIVTVTAFGSAHEEPAATPIRSGTTASILGKISDGTPPPAAPRKPQFIVDRRDILETATCEQGGRIVTSIPICKRLMCSGSQHDPKVPGSGLIKAESNRIEAWLAANIKDIEP